jgi:hypothetical protein
MLEKPFQALATLGLDSFNSSAGLEQERREIGNHSSAMWVSTLIATSAVVS